MATRIYRHYRNLGSLLKPFDALATARQVSLSPFSPTPGGTLIRTRLFIEFRILQYLNTGGGTLATQWWQDMVPIFGVTLTDSPVAPSEVDDPIGGKDADEWVIWGMGMGQVDGSGPDETFPTTTYVTYKWQPPEGLSESHSERETTIGFEPAVYLVWNWLDRHNKINLGPGTSVTNYDLSINYAIDCLFLEPPS